MSSMQQLHRNDQTREEYTAPSDAHLSQTPQDPAAAQSRGLGGGTDVMGQPVNPTSQVHQEGYPSSGTSANYVNPTSQVHQQGYPSSGTSANYGGSYPTSGGSYVSTPPTADSHTPTNYPGAASTNQYSTAGLPPSQMPPSHSPAAKTSANASQTAQPSPYVQTTSIPGGTGKTPMDSIMNVFNKWGKKAEDMTGNVWNHLKTGPNVADTAMGRIALGTKAMAEGGIENVYRQTFEVAPEEHLLKSYACYLSTSTGPVAGTLYISTHKLAFCSDRPLAIQASGALSGSSNPASAKHSPSSKTHQETTENSASAQQQQQWVFYKVIMPVAQLEAVNPTENTQKKPPERYVQVKTVDGHEFWFMGFVNYDKGVKNLQNTLSSRNTSGTTDNMNATPSSNMYSEHTANTDNAPYDSANYRQSGNMSYPSSASTNAPHHGVNY
ncbi:hypothetical protein L7F22_068786 [Adiantum nelumboides]|nr:hypothetical protein [Adiantum nelumboides]